MKKLLCLTSLGAILLLSACDPDEILLKQSGKDAAGNPVYTINPDVETGVGAAKTVTSVFPFPLVGGIVSVMGSLFLAYARHRAAVKNRVISDSLVAGIADAMSDAQAGLTPAQQDALKNILRSSAVRAGVATEINDMVHAQ